jgi:hypothetical protein
MKTPVLYLGTSAIGGYHDVEWMADTRELWRQCEAGLWRFVASGLVAQELIAAPENVRQLFADTFDASTDLLPFTDEAEALAQAYLAAGVVTPKYADDARHVAICTVQHADHLVSWNFRHLVNVHRAAGFNAVNLLQGYPPVSIVNPKELIYGHAHEQDL